jgi:hypothetical protein
LPAKPDALDTLAGRLIIRNLQVSVPRHLELRHELQRGLRPEPIFERQMRCIAVVGAGASAPLHRRGAQLAKELEELESDRRAFDDELSRLHRVYGLSRDDFETKLAALSRTPQTDQRVREQVSREYADRHPTVLGYELLAHLLKHRFLDAVISFNFDELLDQSLDDELGLSGYRRLISDRDCGDIVHDPDAPDYLPLYVKLHGTAAEPDSLRLTRDAYYRLPQGLMEEVGGLLKSEMTVVLNLGSAMTGFDLHRLPRIPKELEIYDLSFEALSSEVCLDISDERLRAKDDSIFKGERRKKPVFKLLPAEQPRKSKRFGCDQWMEALAGKIEEKSGKNADPKDLFSLVRFRSVDRHIAVARLLGEEQTFGRRDDIPGRDRDSDYLEYLRRRTIVELAFSGAKARGLAQVSWLAVDRSGAYYDLYRRIGRKGGERWSMLRAAGGMDENDWLPDVVESREDLCGKDPVATRTADGRWNLRQFDPVALAKHVGAKIGKSGSRDQKILREALQELQDGSEVEIQATDDQICSKAFDDPLTLPTITALRLFTASLFKDLRPEDEVYISCEIGEWLLDDPVTTELLLRQSKVEVVTAFDLKRGDLDEMYEGRLTHRVINPWRHNRHMTVVCAGSSPSRAVYFARRLRSPLITPVYLEKPRDASRVKQTFDLMLLEEPGRTAGPYPLDELAMAEELDRPVAVEA